MTLAREQLHQTIVEALAAPLTVDALIRKIQPLEGYERKPRRVMLERELHKLVASRRVTREWSKELNDYAYCAHVHSVGGSVGGVRYRIRNAINAWFVDREHPHIPGMWITVVKGTEGEAKKCLRVLDPNASLTP